MRNTTGKRRSWFADPLRAAWAASLLLFGVFALVLWAFPELRITEVDLTVPEKPSPEELERRRAKVKRPEPTERQVREIAERFDRRKRDEMRKKVRALERELEKLEDIAEQRREALGVDANAAFRALLEAIRLKADELGPTRVEEGAARVLASAAGDLARFTTPEDPGLADAATGLLRRTRDHIRLVERWRDLRSFETSARGRAEQALRVTRQLADLVARLARELPESDPAVPSTEITSLADLQPLDEAELEEMTAAELYEHAQLLDEALRGEFAEARATELSTNHSVPLAEALARVDTPPGTSPDLAEALARDAPQNREEFQAFNEALESASAALSAMQAQAESLSAQAEGTSSLPGQAADAEQARRLHASLAEAALQGRGGKARQVVDMTAMMRAMYSGEAMGGESPTDQESGRVAVRTGVGTTMERGLGAGAARRLNQAEIIAQLLPGRKFSRESERQGWLYIDTWYVVGPFQRPADSTALRRAGAFPPEIRVDLDATYTGKNAPGGRGPVELRWRFHQSNRLRITPPDEADGSVYYAWTEVYFDEAQEVLVAVASDDAAKVWINDLPVWEDNGLSSWRLDEGFRKVLFKRGYNPVLVRVENGPNVCHFSLLLCPVKR
jgi:hypothetical protein